MVTAAERVLEDVSEKDLSHHCQLVVVGEPASGKTSLIRALTGQRFVTDLDCTNGINITHTSLNSAEDEAGAALLKPEKEDGAITQEIARRILCKALEPQRACKYIGHTQAERSMSIFRRRWQRSEIPGSRQELFETLCEDPGETFHPGFQLTPAAVEEILAELHSHDWRGERTTFVRFIECGGQQSVPSSLPVCASTNDSIYAVMFNVSKLQSSATFCAESGREGAHSPVRCSEPLLPFKYILHWLSTISEAVDDTAAVFLIGTHSDLADEETLERARDHLLLEIPRSLSNLRIVGPVFVDSRPADALCSSSAKQQMEKLQAMLREEIQLIKK